VSFFCGKDKSLLEIIICILLIQLGSVVEQRMAVNENVLREDPEGPLSDHEEEFAEFEEGEETEGEGDNGTEYEDETGTTTETETETEEENENSNG